MLLQLTSAYQLINRKTLNSDKFLGGIFAVFIGKET